MHRLIHGHGNLDQSPRCAFWEGRGVEHSVRIWIMHDSEGVSRTILYDLWNRRFAASQSH